MSQDLYSKWWVLTKDQLAHLQQYDHFIKRSAKPTKDRVVANSLVAGLYARYCMIVQDLDACVDQYAQVQKSITMRKLMDAAVTRLYELKELLNNIDLSEIHYIDGSLVELKLVPYNIEILNPALLFPRPEDIEDMWEKIKKGERLFTPPPPPPAAPPPEEVDSLELLLKPQNVAPKEQSNQEKTEEEKKEEKPDEEHAENQQEDEQPKEEAREEKKKKKKPIKKFVLEPKVLTEEEIEAIKKKEALCAILKLIQIHERARQARVYYQDKRAIKMRTPDPTKGPIVKEAVPDPELTNKGAMEFQKLYRGYTVRQEMARREGRRRLLIGMTSPSWHSTEEFEKVQKTMERRREIVKQHIREYIEANIKEKDRLMRVVAPGLMEDVGDEIREWFRQWYLRARTFDKYPPEYKGGTVLVVRCETMTPEEYIDDYNEKKRQRNRGGADKAKQEAEKKKKEMEKKKQEEAKKKKEKEAKEKAKRKKQEFELKFDESKADHLLTEGFKEYRKLWKERKDEDNPEDKVYMDMVTDEKCCEMQYEVRKQVDELMRAELELLKDALAYDKAKKKGKKGKKGGKGKKKKGKKGKGKKGKGKKKKKDMTANRTTEDLFQELVDAGVIHTYPLTHLSDFKGDMSYSNWEKRCQEYDPMPALGDIRQVVALNCILPIGVQNMKKPRSVLIAGPRQCGKHVLANAIFTETKSVLFDISPPILAGKYQGKQDMKLLVHLIYKMSRLLAPSVIFIDGAEKPFYKKVPKDEKDFEPKKMGKQIFKGIVKTIKPEDRVLLLGITAQPWAAKKTGLNKAFDKVILIPRTDYGSAYLYLYELLMAYHGVDRNLNISSLAKFAVKFPLGQLKEFVEKVLTPRRIIELSYNPLRQEELYGLLISNQATPVTDKEFKKFTKWFNKTALAKKRAKYMKVVERRRELEARQAEKAKAKKKK